jgi:anionic cell wall polymer biosynthesis LytR-Cps2A-Psr (LCP) family protein
MTKLFTTLVATIIVSGLSVNAFAADVAAPTKDIKATATNSVVKKVDVKKESNVKDSLKKLVPSAKPEAAK